MSKYDLQQYAQLDASEYGEMSLTLLELLCYKCELSTKLVKLLEKEERDILNYYHKNCSVTTEKKTIKIGKEILTWNV